MGSRKIKRKLRKKLSLNSSRVIHSNEIDRSFQSALSFFHQGLIGQAEQTLQRIISAKPSHGNSLHLLGVISGHKRNFPLALHYLRQAVQVNEGNKDFIIDYANTLLLSRNYREAILQFKKLHKAEPEDPDCNYNLGLSFLYSGDFKLAINYFMETVRLDTDYAKAYYNLGNTYRELGDVKKAVEALEQCIKIDQHYAEAYYLLAITRKFTDKDLEISSMQDLVSSSSLTNDKNVYLHFGLGKIYEGLELFAESFHHYAAGNRLYRNSFNYNHDQNREMLTFLKNSFSSDFLRKSGHKGSLDESPIFILGMPRSGTSLVEQILSSHPQVVGAGELYAMNDTLLTPVPEIGYAHVLDDFFTLEAGAYKTLADSYLKNILHMKDAVVNYVVDKMPQNFLYIGFIKTILPNSKIIHCCRSPLDTCFSCYKTFFPMSQMWFAYDLKELGYYHKFYQEIMDFWHELFPDVIYNVHYEKIVSDQENETKKLLEHCGLEWDEKCLEFYKAARQVRTASAVQVRQPIYNNSVGKWRYFSDELKPLIEILDG